MECHHKQTDLLVVGAGPGGYVAAFLAADRGLKVTLVDSSAELGGVCLNRGCIPSKALLHVTKIISSAKEAEKFGVTFNAPQIDLTKIREHKNNVVSRLTNGLKQLCKARKVEFIQGLAYFASDKIAVISTEKEETPIEFKKAIIATGSSPVGLPEMPLSAQIMDSTAALELNDIPPSLLVIGGGYIGLELGSVYAKLGSEVTVVEMMDHLLTGTDADLVKILERSLKKTFKNIYTATKVNSIKEDNGKLLVAMENQKGGFETAFDKILMAVGRKPNTGHLNLNLAKVVLDEKGFIKVNGIRQTSNPNIYAIGDVTGAPMLAHKASAEAMTVVEALTGHKKDFSPKAIPAVIFTDPEIAVCGLSEVQAKLKNIDIEVHAFPWAVSGRAITLNRMDGLTKLITDKKGKILGAGIVGIDAGELIAETALAIEQELTLKDLAHLIHPHPTLSETTKECADVALKQCAHLFRL